MRIRQSSTVYIQVDEACPAHVGGDEFGRHLDGGEEQREIAGCSWA